MPDITMCTGQGCERRTSCYRHVATPSRWQAYFATPPVLDDGSCEYLSPLRGPPTLAAKEEG